MNGIILNIEKMAAAANREEWKDIAVFGEMLPDGQLHSGTAELLKEARKLADSGDAMVDLVLIGTDLLEAARICFAMGTDRVFLYEDPRLAEYRPERFTSVFTHFIEHYKPARILFDGTAQSRELAGLTAAEAGKLYGENPDMLLSAQDPDPENASASVFPDPEHRGELVFCELPDFSSEC